MNIPWYPVGARQCRTTTTAVGSLIAYQHTVYRLVDVWPVPEVDWTDEQHRRVAACPEGRRDTVLPRVYVLRPAGITSEDPRARDHDLHVAPPPYAAWDVYPDEHYPICASCGEPVPCRERHAERVATAEMARVERYTAPGVCPACGEVVSSQQKSLRFAENVVVPGGPPLTFHQRRDCYGDAVDYEEKWANATHRHPRLSCRGDVTVHGDGSYDCTHGADCPGAQVMHRGSHSVCRCPDCHTRGSFGCRLSPNARNNALNAAEGTTR